MQFVNRLLGRDPASYRFLFLLGAMKSGTSTLAHMLRQHPRILYGAHKEPAHFVTLEPRLATLRDYMANWNLKKARKTDSYLLDASTSYTKYPTFGDSASLMAGTVKTARFLYMMRDPIKRIESQLAHNISRSEPDLALYKKERENPDFYKHYLYVSSYGAQLARFLAHYEQADIYLILFEDFIKDTRLVLQHVWQFLDLPEPEQDVSLPHVNARPDRLPYEGDLIPAEIREALVEDLKDDMLQLKDTWRVDVSRWGF